MAHISQSVSPIQHAAAQLLSAQGTDLRSFIEDHRATGLSWARVARKLAEATNEIVDVTAETVRRWGTDIEEGDAA
jgi:hypothetical protein